MHLTPVAVPYTLAHLKPLLPSPPARIAEAGCGQGALAVALADLGYDVTGVDRNAEMAASARERRVHVIQADIAADRHRREDPQRHFRRVRRGVIHALSAPRREPGQHPGACRHTARPRGADHHRRIRLGACESHRRRLLLRQPGKAGCHRPARRRYSFGGTCSTPGLPATTHSTGVPPCSTPSVASAPM